MRGLQRVWPPAAASPILPTLYLLSWERAVGQPKCRARETHQLAGQCLPLQDVLLQGLVGVQAANDVSPRRSLTLPDQWVCPTWLYGISRAR